METKNYNLFSYTQNNRKINGGLVNRIIDSINQIGYVKARPIIVDESFKIIDGQHRFEACKQLGLPIYYEITNIDGNRAMILLNKTQLIWRLQEYIEHWSIEGIDCYVKLVEFEQQYHFGVSNDIIIVLKSGWCSNLCKAIREGKKIELNPKMQEVTNFLLECKHLVPYWKTKNFIHSIVLLVERANSNDCKKVLKNIQAVRQQVSPNSYLAVFENIINKGKIGINKISLTHKS